MFTAARELLCTLMPWWAPCHHAANSGILEAFHLSLAHVILFRGLWMLLVLYAGFQRKMSTFKHDFPSNRLVEFGVKMRLIRVLLTDVVLDASRWGFLTMWSFERSLVPFMWFLLCP